MSSATPAHPWRRFVAIGDSFTEGMLDPDPDAPGDYRGWADRLAATLTLTAPGKDVRYANLAIRGRLVHDVVGPQLDAALALKPDLLAMSAGGNDILRRHSTVEEVRDVLEDATRRAHAAGAHVIMATGPHLGHFPLLRRFNGAFGQFSANVRTICADLGATCLDVWGFRPLRHPRMWAPDRIHLSDMGHARIADVAAVALGVPPTDPTYDVPLPPLAPPTRWQETVDTAQWAGRDLGPWLQRRLQGRSSGDTVTAKRPTLQPVDVEYYQL